MAEQTFVLTISGIDGPEDRAARLMDAVAELVLEMGYDETFVSQTTEAAHTDLATDAPVDAEEEALIRERLASAARNALPNYPPKLLQRLLDDARSLKELLDWERSRRGVRQ